MKIRKRITVLVLSMLILSVFKIAGSVAYHNTAVALQNQLAVKGSGVMLNEVFNPRDRWLPGETKEKEVNFGNCGNFDQVLRFKVTESWFHNNGTPDNLSDDTPFTWTGSYAPAPAVINWTSEISGPGANWVQIGGWYYYTHIFEKQSGPAPTLTANVIESVSFSNAISNSDPGFPDSFADKRYSLVVQMETLDVDSALTKAEWGMQFTQSGNDLSWSVYP